MTKVKDSCEKIQHFGNHKDETGTHDEPDDQVCLDHITEHVTMAKNDFREAEKALRKFYNDEGDDEEEEEEDDDSEGEDGTDSETSAKEEKAEAEDKK